MNEAEVRSTRAMPLTSPAYGTGPVRFVAREMLTIAYRTDPIALARVVPAPLQPAAAIVHYEFIRMPDSTGFGSYSESGQVIPVTFEGREGSYTHAMYVDDFAAIASGREVMGYPKVLGSPRVEVRRDVIVGTLDYGPVRVATGTIAFKQKEATLSDTRRALETPGYLVKIIPHVDGSPRICELVRFRVADLVIKGAWTGSATLELHPHVLAPVAELPVLQVLGATHVIADLCLGNAEVVHDYLR